VKYPYRYAWGNNPVRAKMKNKRCRVLASGTMNSVALEFEDGMRMVSSRRALRKRKKI